MTTKYKSKYTTFELIIYLDNMEGARDIYGDGDSRAHEPEMMEIKSRLLDKKDGKIQVHILEEKNGKKIREESTGSN